MGESISGTAVAIKTFLWQMCYWTSAVVLLCSVCNSVSLHPSPQPVHWCCCFILFLFGCPLPAQKFLSALISPGCHLEFKGEWMGSSVAWAWVLVFWAGAGSVWSHKWTAGSRSVFAFPLLYVYVESGVWASISDDWMTAFPWHIWPTALAPSLRPWQLSSSRWRESSPMGIATQPHVLQVEVWH